MSASFMKNQPYHDQGDLTVLCGRALSEQAFWRLLITCGIAIDTEIKAKRNNIISELPSDTKLLLTKNYSEVIIFGKITNLMRNSLKMSFFPGHSESTK